MARIGLCGTMSIGKSTLVKELSKLPQFENYHIATEKSIEIKNKGIKLNTDSTLMGQIIFAGYRIEELLHKNLLTDRSIIDVMAFTNSAKSISLLRKEEFEIYFSQFISEYDYIFYISPEGIPIENNSIRETDPKYRNLIDLLIKNLIIKYNHKIKNFHEIYGTTNMRIEQIMKIIS